MMTVKYDICNPIAVVDGVNTGKLTQVRKSTYFDPGLYDITTFSEPFYSQLIATWWIFGF